MCILESLFRHLPDVSINSIVSTTSGGSVGYLLYEQLNGTMTFPHYDPNVTFAAIDRKMRAPRHHWFANLVSVIPPDGPYAELVLDAFMGLAKSYDEWFSKTLQLLDLLLYGGRMSAKAAAQRRWYSSVALMARNHLPIELDNTTGVYSGAAEGLSLAVVELDNFPTNHHVNISGPLAVGTSRIAKSDSMTRWDEVAHSVFFWGTDIISNPAKLASQETALPFGDLLPSRTKVAFLDGGLVDPTGMAALLQRRVESVVLFYNVNHPLTMVDAGLAWLWGRDSKAPGNAKHACLHGPRLGKVFAYSDVYDEVYSNLTDPEIMRARLTDVDVQTNEFLGIK